MNKRKEIIKEYKDRKLKGGIYTIMNTLNGKYLIGHTADIKSVQNRFQFSVTTGLAIHPKLQKDWQAAGAQAFRLKILEELEQQSEQSKAEFMEDLNTLEHMWRENLDVSKEY